MGRLVEDWTAAAAHVARARTAPGADSGVPGAGASSSGPTYAHLGGSSSSSSSSSSSNNPPLLEVSDFRAYVAQAHPLLALPTESLAPHLLPRAPPSHTPAEAAHALSRHRSSAAGAASGSSATALGGGDGDGADADAAGEGGDGDAAMREGGGGAGAGGGDGKGAKGGVDAASGSAFPLAAPIGAVFPFAKRRGRPPKHPVALALSGLPAPSERGARRGRGRGSRGGGRGRGGRGGAGAGAGAMGGPAPAVAGGGAAAAPAATAPAGPPRLTMKLLVRAPTAPGK
jgi:hypothetical protein